MCRSVCVQYVGGFEIMEATKHVRSSPIHRDESVKAVPAIMPSSAPSEFNKSESFRASTLTDAGEEKGACGYVQLGLRSLFWLHLAFFLTQ